MSASPQRDAAGRRTRLREYQAQLLERMQAARTAAGARINQLGVQVGSSADGPAFLLDLTQAGEIVTLPEVTPVPLTQPWYLGLANLRGNLVGIVDLAAYLELGTTAPGPDTRIITLAPTLKFNCALVVGRVHGLRQAADMQAAGDHLVDAAGKAWTPFDLAALVREPRFLHVGF
jgi:twitching motility protein PilI